MTSFHIKLIAVVLMVIDHIGVVFFPDILLLRIVGRLSFPLFAWLIGEGEKHTRNFKLYLIRLIALGIISQPFYYLLFREPQLNILATLALGLLAIRLDKVTSLQVVFTFFLAMLAQVIRAEAGAYGVLMIVLLSKFEANSIPWWGGWIVFNIISTIPYAIDSPSLAYQFFAVLGPVLLLWWNGQLGLKAKWFYTFYPLHLAILLVIKLLLNGYFDRFQLSLLG